MKAAIIREHGDINAINVETVPDPEPKVGEALIRVRACALNHMDLWARKGIPGFAFPLPLIPGCDISGVVVQSQTMPAGQEVVIQPGVSCGACTACTSDNDHLCKGYGILGETQHGGCAELVAVPEANLIPKPSNLTFAEAAAYPLTFLTSWHMLVSRCQITEGDIVLIHAAGSGVGYAALQIARLHKARVIATAGSQTKCDLAMATGAELAINYKEDPQWAKTVYIYTKKTWCRHRLRTCWTSHI